MSRDIIVVGQQKTGTTGVYSLIKAAVAPMAVEYYFLFEPSTGEPIENIKAADPSLSVVTKIMYKDVSKFRPEMFDRRVLTSRDPRDTIVSTLLFKPMVKGVADAVPIEQHERFLEALRRKEADPAGVAVERLMEIADEVGYRKHKPKQFVNEMIEMADFAERERFFLVRYEDVVDGEVTALSNYLDLLLNPEVASTPSWLTHIVRSREHGAWRHWFTKSDVDVYRPLLSSCLARMGYEEDWELADEQVIDPESSSAFVADRLRRRRRELSLPKTADGEAEAVDITALVSMANDGDVEASFKLARLLANGDTFGGKWPVSARYWAHRAELQGVSQGAATNQWLRQVAGRAQRAVAARARRR